MTLGDFGIWYFAVLNPTKIPGKTSRIFYEHRDKQIYGVITRGSRVNESKYQELTESGRSERGKERDWPYTEARQSTSNRISSQITRIGVWATRVRSIAQAARWPEKDERGFVTPLLAWLRQGPVSNPLCTHVPATTRHPSILPPRACKSLHPPPPPAPDLDGTPTPPSQGVGRRR